MATLDENGHEVLDDTPVALPLRLKRLDNDARRIQDIVQGVLSQRAREVGFESFEEANDFDVGDDFDPRSPYEITDVQDEFFERDKRRARREARFAAEGNRKGEQRVRGSGEKKDESVEGVQPGELPVGGAGDRAEAKK